MLLNSVTLQLRESNETFEFFVGPETYEGELLLYILPNSSLASQASQRQPSKYTVGVTQVTPEW